MHATSVAYCALCTGSLLLVSASLTDQSITTQQGSSAFSPFVCKQGAAVVRKQLFYRLTAAPMFKKLRIFAIIRHLVSLWNSVNAVYAICWRYFCRKKQSNCQLTSSSLLPRAVQHLSTIFARLHFLFRHSALF